MYSEDLIAANEIGESVGVDAIGFGARGSETSSPPVANDDLAEACLKRVANPHGKRAGFADDPRATSNSAQRLPQRSAAGRHDDALCDCAASISDRHGRRI